MITKLLAQGSPTDLGKVGGDPAQGFGPWGNIVNLGKDVEKSAGFFTDTISRLIGILTIIAGIWFIFNFIAGAYAFMTAGGSDDSIKKATAKITQSLIGLVVVVASYAIISLLSGLLGFPNLLEPQEAIKILHP